MRKIDLTGKRFSRLVVISEADRKQGQTSRWLCKCDCGNEKIIKGNHLTSGLTKSCGCLRSEIISKRVKTHGMYGTRIYSIWANMLQRCYNQRERSYKYYGARGIKVCDKWKRFEGFLEDMGGTYQEHLSIDRINVNGDYCSENCKWATKEEQANNTRANHLITINGETDTLANVCKKYNLNYKTVHKKLKKGIPIEKLI